MRTIKRIAVTLGCLLVWFLALVGWHWVWGETTPDPVILISVLVGYIGCDIYCASDSLIGGG